MSTSLLLRIAAVLTLFYFLGHTSGYPWTPGTGPAELPVINAMKGPSFDVVGSTRTYWDFYLGFGITISLFLLLSAVVLWQIAALSRSGMDHIRPIIATFLIASVINTALAYKYFFIIPTATSIAIVAALALAFYSAGKAEVRK